jgi:hypothetical protein
MSRRVQVLWVSGAILLFAANSSRAGALDDWLWRNPLPQGNPVGAVWYGNGIFLTAGARGTLLISTNGTDWTLHRTPGTCGGIVEIIYAQGKYVAVGDNIMTSTNAIDWVCRAPANPEKYHLAYGNGTFVATGPYDDIATSPDGITWTPRTLGICCNELLNITDIAFGSGRFVIIGYPSATAVSTDGLTWPTNAEIEAVTFGAGQFVAVGAQYHEYSYPQFGQYELLMMRSTNGSSWDATLPWIRGRLYAATYGNGTFVAIGESSSLLTSSDGFMTWTTQRFPPGVSYYFSDVIWAGGLFAACANGGILLTSPDGTNWTPHVTGAETIQSLGYRQGQFVGVGHEGSII